MVDNSMIRYQRTVMLHQGTDLTITAVVMMQQLMKTGCYCADDKNKCQECVYLSFH